MTETDEVSPLLRDPCPKCGKPMVATNATCSIVESATVSTLCTLVRCSACPHWEYRDQTGAVNATMLKPSRNQNV